MNAALDPTLPPPPTSTRRVGRSSASASGSASGSPSARLEDVAAVGDLILADLAGESVIVVRADDGLHAFYNVCRHRGAELVDATARRADRSGP